jgi:hypothetical protein
MANISSLFLFSHWFFFDLVDAAKGKDVVYRDSFCLSIHFYGLTFPLFSFVGVTELRSEAQSRIWARAR